MIVCLIVVWLLVWNWVKYWNFLKVKWEGIKGLSKNFHLAFLTSMNSNSFQIQNLGENMTWLLTFKNEKGFGENLYSLYWSGSTAINLQCCLVEGVISVVWCTGLKWLVWTTRMKILVLTLTGQTWRWWREGVYPSFEGVDEKEVDLVIVFYHLCHWLFLTT